MAMHVNRVVLQYSNEFITTKPNAAFFLIKVKVKELMRGLQLPTLTNKKKLDWNGLAAINLSHAGNSEDIWKTTMACDSEYIKSNVIGHMNRIQLV